MALAATDDWNDDDWCAEESATPPLVPLLLEEVAAAAAMAAEVAVVLSSPLGMRARILVLVVGDSLANLLSGETNPAILLKLNARLAADTGSSRCVVPVVVDDDADVAFAAVIALWVADAVAPSVVNPVPAMNLVSDNRADACKLLDGGSCAA